VYAVPVQNGTFYKYATTGKVPSEHYNVTSQSSRLDPRSLKVLHELQSKDPDALTLELMEQQNSAEKGKPRT